MAAIISVNAVIIGISNVSHTFDDDWTINCGLTLHVNLSHLYTKYFLII